MLVLLIAIALALAVVAVVWLTYNRMVARRNALDNSWSLIDVELKPRHDLITNLVEAVRGYAGHERATLERVTEARGDAIARRVYNDTVQSYNTLIQIFPAAIIARLFGRRGRRLVVVLDAH